MAVIRVNGDSSGYVQLSAPSNAGNTTVTLPTTSGTVQLVPGAWTDFAINPIPSSGSFTSVTTNFSKYTQIGKAVTVSADFTITSIGTGTGYFKFTLPVTARAAFCGFGSWRERALSGISGPSFVEGTTVGALTRYDNVGINMATNWSVSLMLTYEAA
jgi:hypothetical protein